MRNFFLGILLAVGFSSYADNLGKQTYELACQNCHRPDLAKAIKSPAAFDKKAWDLRFQKASLKSKENPQKYPTAMDYLLESVSIGRGLMHHGGLCHEANKIEKDCSKEALTAAINYMSGR